MKKFTLLWKILTILLIMIISFLLFLEFNLGGALPVALKKYDWVENEAPLRDFKLRHVSYFPNRYLDQMELIIKDGNTPLLEKRLAVFVCCLNSDKSLIKVIDILLADKNNNIANKSDIFEEAFCARLKKSREFQNPELRVKLAKAVKHNLVASDDLKLFIVELNE